MQRSTDVGGDPNKTLLCVRDLRVDLVSAERTVHAVRGLSYELARGEALGLVGESGSGKTMAALALMRLLPQPIGRVTSGTIAFDGRDLLHLSDEQLRRVRGREIAMVFQDPLSSLNPVLTIRSQITETLHRHLGLSGRAANDRAIELLTLVGIPAAARRAEGYPHEFSGGMRQRVMIAMALACHPLLVIADEPTTSLDVTVQAQILDLLARLRADFGMAVVLITHDMGVVAGFTDRIAVMYAGRIVEEGPVATVLASPQHPYTAGLLGSMPRLDRPPQEELHAIEGAPPDLATELVGCPFRPRCPLAMDRCAADDPPFEAATIGTSFACWAVPHA
jgi:oligopeptide/dipeptide ABC transporter ATP-binding protein